MPIQGPKLRTDVIRPCRAPIAEGGLSYDDGITYYYLILQTFDRVKYTHRNQSFALTLATTRPCRSGRHAVTSELSSDAVPAHLL